MTPAHEGKNATVAPDSYLPLHYRLADLDGTAHVSTFDLSPATLQMGSGQLAGTLEGCLIGLATGERHVFELAADKAFGPHNPRLVERIARSALPPESAAAPRPCVWMDSGEAIARRLAHVLIAKEGAPRVRRAAFTSADGAQASLRAFEARGYCDFSHIAEAPSFEVAPLVRAPSA